MSKKTLLSLIACILLSSQAQAQLGTPMGMRQYSQRSYLSGNSVFANNTASVEKQINSTLTGNTGVRDGGGVFVGQIATSWEINPQSGNTVTMSKVAITDYQKMDSLVGTGNANFRDTAYPVSAVSGHYYRARVDLSKGSVAGTINIRVRNSDNTYIPVNANVTASAVHDSYFTATQNDTVAVAVQFTSGDQCTMSEISLKEITLDTWAIANTLSGTNYLQFTTTPSLVMVSSGASCIGVYQTPTNYYQGNYTVRYFVNMGGVTSGNATITGASAGINLAGTSGLKQGETAASYTRPLTLTTQAGQANNYIVLGYYAYKIKRSFSSPDAMGIMRKN